MCYRRLITGLMGLSRPHGAKRELKTSYVSRNQCTALTVKISVWPAFKVLSSRLPTFQNTDFCLKGKVSILLWRTKQTDWWSKAFCQIYNTKWCRRRTLTSFVRHPSNAQLALFCFVKVLLFPSALTQAEKCIDLFRSNSWTFQSAAEVGEQNCFSL